MLAGDLANPTEEAFGSRAAATIGADAAGPRPEAIFVIPAHWHRCRRSMQKHNETPDSAAKSSTNIGVSPRRGTATTFWTVPRAVSHPVCRPRTFRAMVQRGAIRFNLALRLFHYLRPPAVAVLRIIALKSAHRIDHGAQRGAPLEVRAMNSDVPLGPPCNSQPNDGSSPERSVAGLIRDRPSDCGRCADEVLWSTTPANSGALIQAAGLGATTTPGLARSPSINGARAAT